MIRQIADGISRGPLLWRRKRPWDNNMTLSFSLLTGHKRESPSVTFCLEWAEPFSIFQICFLFAYTSHTRCAMSKVPKFQVSQKLENFAKKSVVKSEGSVLGEHLFTLPLRRKCIEFLLVFGGKAPFCKRIDSLQGVIEMFWGKVSDKWLVTVVINDWW